MYNEAIVLTLVASFAVIATSFKLPPNYNVFDEVDKYLNHVVEKVDPRLDFEFALRWCYFQPLYYPAPIFFPGMLGSAGYDLYYMNTDFECNQTKVDDIVYTLFEDPLTKGKINQDGRLFKGIEYNLKLNEKLCSGKKIDLSRYVRKDNPRFSLLKKINAKYNVFAECDKYLTNVIKSDDAEINIKAAIEWLKKQDPNKGSYSAMELASRLKELYGLRNDKICYDSADDADIGTPAGMVFKIYNDIYTGHPDLINWDGPLLKTVLAYLRIHFDTCALFHKETLEKAWKETPQMLKDYAVSVANLPKVCDFYTPDLRKGDSLWPYECLRRHFWIVESIFANPMFNTIKNSKRAIEDFSYLFNGGAKHMNRSEVEEDVTSLICTEVINALYTFERNTVESRYSASLGQFLTGYMNEGLYETYKAIHGLGRQADLLLIMREWETPLKRLAKDVTDIIYTI